MTNNLLKRKFVRICYVRIEQPVSRRTGGWTGFREGALMAFSRAIRPAWHKFSEFLQIVFRKHAFLSVHSNARIHKAVQHEDPRIEPLGNDLIVKALPGFNRS